MAGIGLHARYCRTMIRSGVEFIFGGFQDAAHILAIAGGSMSIPACGNVVLASRTLGARRGNPGRSEHDSASGFSARNVSYAMVLPT